MKHFLVIFLLPLICFSQDFYKGNLLPDSTSIEKKAIQKANRDWANGTAYHIIGDHHNFNCLIDSTTGLRYTISGIATPDDHFFNFKYMEELKKLCKEKGLPSNNYLSIRDLICNPIEFVLKNLERKESVKLGAKKEMTINNEKVIYSVELDSNETKIKLLNLKFYNSKTEMLLLGVLEQGSNIYFIEGLKNIGYFIILNKKKEIELIKCFDMKTKDLLSTTHNKAG